jgi:NADPH:quinone reductase-like Zn-dependent oxidoreductase
VLSVFVRQQLRALITTKNQHELVVVKELIEADKLKPVISTSYTLHEVPKAMRHFEEGRARGKVVITH